MNEIYRLRPVIDKTIEELTEPYLWFSRPTEYNDIEDANVIAFSNQNATVKDLFELIFENSEDLGKELSRLGMCCFTKYLPKATEWGRFPKGHNSIFIEYDKKYLKNIFVQNIIWVIVSKKYNIKSILLFWNQVMKMDMMFFGKRLKMVNFINH
ncbi:hypothetical protein NXW23_11830 [Bacteroides caccae]|uniref:Uncharacterized protein n=1 Tax=Bacteroides caccae TaxID=47678 RepID=A0AA94Y299_9BACE|nr:hypothetical protein NXW23_11830 [Bacteroides caccae]